MKIRIECVMGGGPEHGRILNLRQGAARPCSPAIVVLDGQLWQCAVRRRSHRGTTRCMLMHPQAIFIPLLEMLAACRPDTSRAASRGHRNPSARSGSNDPSTLSMEASR